MRTGGPDAAIPILKEAIARAPYYDLWYEALLNKAVGWIQGKCTSLKQRLNPAGPPMITTLYLDRRPLGGKDFPSKLGLSLRAMARKDA